MHIERHRLDLYPANLYNFIVTQGTSGKNILIKEDIVVPK